MAQLKRYAAHQEQEGLQGLGMALVGTPASWLMDRETAGSRSQCVDSLSFWDPIPKFKEVACSLYCGTIPKESPLLPYPTTPVFLKEDEPMPQVAPLAQGATEAIAGPSGSSTLPVGLPRVCHIANQSLPAKVFKWMNL